MKKVLYFLAISIFLFNIIADNVFLKEEDYYKSAEMIASFISNEYERQLLNYGEADIKEIIKKAKKMDKHLILLHNKDNYLHSVVIMDGLDRVLEKVNIKEIKERLEEREKCIK